MLRRSYMYASGPTRAPQAGTQQTLAITTPWLCNHAQCKLLALALTLATQGHCLEITRRGPSASGTGLGWPQSSPTPEAVSYPAARVRPWQSCADMDSSAGHLLRYGSHSPASAAMGTSSFVLESQL